MTKTQLHYSEMPTHIRLMVVMLVFAAVSDFARMFFLSILAAHGHPNVPISMAAVSLLLFGTMRMLKTKTGAAPAKAVQVVAVGLVNDGYAIFAMRDMFDSMAWLALWWPIMQCTAYAMFIAILLSPATFSFYRGEH